MVMSDEEQDERGGIPGEPTGPPEPQAVLSELAVLRRRTRSARHAYWGPLVLFGLLSCAAAPLYDSAPPMPSGITEYTATAATPSILGGSGFNSSPYLGWYWLFALIGGFLLTMFWYRWHGRRAGVQTAALGFLVTGIVLTVAALLVPLLSPLLPPLGWLWLGPGDLWVRGTFAFLIIAAGLWVLAWAERSRALAITAVVYTAAALLASLYNLENILFRLGWNPGPSDLPLTVLPGVLLPAAVLLIAGAAAGGAAFAARRRAQPA
jgi:hypothetical protein